jgi:hypothetical protein
MGKKYLFALFGFVIILFTGCEKKRDPFTRYEADNKPSIAVSKELIGEDLRALAYDPKSVKINDVNEAKYSEEMGWVMLCDFSWTGLHNFPERSRWWFSIKGFSSVRIIDDQDAAEDFYYNRIRVKP